MPYVSESNYAELLHRDNRLAAVEAELAKAREDVARLREALIEVDRRTGLLISQNTGRWNMTIEHDQRTVDVLQGNQRIALAVLGATE